MLGNVRRHPNDDTQRETRGSHCESYDWAPQLFYIHGMSPGMLAKQTANTLVNVLGVPLHAQLIDTARHPQCLRAYIQLDRTFSYPQSIPYIIDEGLRETLGDLKITYNSKAPRCIKCVRFCHQMLSSDKTSRKFVGEHTCGAPTQR